MRVLAVLLCGLTATAHARDPFAAPPPPARPATPLERVDLDRLRLVGLVYGPVPRAMLEEDTGAVHRATVGTPVGPRGGVVAAIEPGRLRVCEPGGDEVVLILHGAGEGAP
jgi:Tfp pilus assembly protein PilP